MKFTLTKQTLIGFTVFLTILLGSCGVAEDTAPPGPSPDYMNFTLTNLGGGALVNPTTPLSRGDTYRLTITPTNGTTIPTADYTITNIPTDAITINVTRTNSVDFTVNNTATTSVTVTVTHKTDSSVSESVTLNLAPQDYMSFVLTNRNGATVATTTELSRGSTYGLVITPVSGVMPVTADYTISHIPADAIILDVTLTNSVDFTVNNTADTSVTVTVTHRTNSAVSESITLNLASQVVTTFQQDIENATTVPNLIIANAITREVLSPLSPLGSLRGGATLVKRYVTTNGGATTQDGISWATAWAATSLRANINAISDATANRVYLIMVAGATYKPTYANPGNRGDSFSMKNYVAIMGGFDPAGGWGRTGTTIFSGDIGAAGNGDNTYNVFFHNGITLNNAHLYGVTITNGNANGSNPQNVGGGMHNNGSSPVLTKVVFSGNTASWGGGMYNSGSSPVLTRVVFSGNTADNGGGMYNFSSSSSVLTEVVFSGNTAAGSGGGMYNNTSSPVLTEVVFSGNTVTGAFGGGGMYNNGSSSVLTRVVFSDNSATRSGGGGMRNFVSSPVLTSVVFSGNTTSGDGGGMYNVRSSLVIIGAVFTNNRAANGGAMWNDNGSTQTGPLIVNTIFSDNTTNVGTGYGPDIAMNLGRSAGTENIRIAGSVLGLGLAQPTNDIVGYGGTAALNIFYHSLANGVVNFGADATLTINGMNFLYPTITGGSAVNLGLFVRRSGTTYYFSEDESTWYTGFSATGGWGSTGTPPANAIDLTATDIAGNARNARPDAGVHEVR